MGRTVGIGIFLDGHHSGQRGVAPPVCVPRSCLVRHLFKIPVIHEEKICSEWVLSASAGVARSPVDFCSATTEAERRPQDIRGMSALRRPKRSGDLGPMGACHATTEAMRKMGRVRSGGPHATSRPSRRRDLEPWVQGSLRL